MTTTERELTLVAGALDDARKQEERRKHAIFQLMFALEDMWRDRLYDAAESNSHVLYVHISRLTDAFADEWAKVSEDVHEELGEDYVEEIEKLADWVANHADDIMNNDLEYGLYQAANPKYVMWDEAVDDDGKVLTSEATPLGECEKGNAWNKMVGLAIRGHATDMSESPVGNSDVKWRFGDEIEIVQRDRAGMVTHHHRYRLVVEREEVK